jgi:two-component system, OmpR family, phosphate regulon sensor histidine kinase PhoR
LNTGGALLAAVILLVLALAAWLIFHYRKENLKARMTQAVLRRDKQELATQLSQQSTLLETLAEITETAWLAVSYQGEVLYWNKAAEKFFGKPEAGLTLMKWTREDRLAELVDQAILEEAPPPIYFNHSGQDFRATARAINEPGGVRRIAVILRDVSELQRLGRARRDFVANISHEIRNPLASIQLLAETLIADACQNPEESRNLLQKILIEKDALRQLSQEMLDLSMIESGRAPLKLKETRLLPLVELTVERLAPQAAFKNLAINVEVPEEINILADEAMIGRVLSNLLHNAIKFTQQGTIIITAATVSHKEGPLVKIGVHDTGIGIPPADLQRIFERFYKADRSRSKGGTGLGLAIARHIVEGHGGQIWAESQEGRGASFYFTLPAAD